MAMIEEPIEEETIPGQDLPFVSVIVAVKNGQNTISRCIESIMEQDYPHFELIVVDDGSTDKTPKLLTLQFDDRLVVITKPQSLGPSAARNEGVKRSRAEFVAFTDGDCLVTRTWLRDLVVCFSDPSVAGAGGTQLVPDDDTAFGRLIGGYLHSVGFATEYLKEDDGAHITMTDHNPSCNVMYRRAIFDTYGPFLERLWPGEDVELDYRIRQAGYQLRFNPAAAVFHYRSASLPGFARMMYRYGWAQARLVRAYGMFRFLHAVPIGTGAAVIGLGILFTQDPRIFLPVMAGMLLAVWAAFIVRARSLSLGVTYAVLFWITIVFWNLGFCAGFTGLQRTVIKS